MPSDADFLTVEDLTARYRVSKYTVYQWNWAKSGPPYIKVGRYIRYKVSDVLAWEAARIKNPTEATP